MRIIPTINFHYQPTAVHCNTMSNPMPVDNKGLACDKFERTNISSGISFQSNVSEGQFLRGLSGIHDPYSGVIILNNKELDQIYQDLAQTHTSRAKIKYLAQYTESMLPVEKTAFNMLEIGIKQNSRVLLKEILSDKKPHALENLIKKQGNTFKKMYKLTSNLSEENRNKVQSTIFKAERQINLPHEDNNHFKKSRFMNELIRISQYKTLGTIEEHIKELPESEKESALERLYDAQRILENNSYNVNVKGKTPLEYIHELQTEFAPETLNEPNELEPIIDLASTLPTSKDSIDAFIVEMADKDDKAIAKRLVSESLGTIEHIVPESKGGVNEAYNFLFVTKSRNEERSNTPIKYFMKKYPNIPNYCTQYMNDIMKAGQSSKLRGHEWYPYVIKETMKEEMGVNVNISSYRVSPQKAFKSFPQRLKEKYPKFEKYFTNPQ